MCVWTTIDYSFWCCFKSLAFKIHHNTQKKSGTLFLKRRNKSFRLFVFQANLYWFGNGPTIAGGRGSLACHLVMPGFMGQAWSNRRIALALRKFSCTKVSTSGHANGVTPIWHPPVCATQLGIPRLYMLPMIASSNLSCFGQNGTNPWIWMVQLCGWTHVISNHLPISPQRS